MIRELLTSLRFAVGTLAVCAVLYPALVLVIGRALAPSRSEGSLIRGPDSEIVGSRLLAQKFERPEYLWPRPSAVDFDASVAGGSNLAPGNPALRDRAADKVARHAPTGEGLLPGELVAASGSGLDPHITLSGALYQTPRIARARGVRRQRVEELVRRGASASTPWSPPLVNVLETNLALDRNLGRPALRRPP